MLTASFFFVSVTAKNQYYIISLFHVNWNILNYGPAFSGDGPLAQPEQHLSYARVARERERFYHSYAHSLKDCFACSPPEMESFLS